MPTCSGLFCGVLAETGVFQQPPSSLSERAWSPTSIAITTTGQAICAVVLPVGGACRAASASLMAMIWGVQQGRCPVARRFGRRWARLAQAQGMIALNVVGQTYQAPLTTGRRQAA